MSVLAERLAEIREAPEGPEVCAFFDYDGTLIDGYSSVDIFRARLLNRDVGVTEARDALRIALRGCTSEQDFAAVLQASRPAFAGRSDEELTAFGAELFRKETASRIRPQMWQLIRAHRDRGHRIVIASSASRYQVAPIADEIGADSALATEVEVIDGIATGEVVGRPPWGTGKAAAVRRLAKEWQLDLQTCFAYSDGDEDVPYLEAVGRPLAVSPQHGMRAVAQERGWPILDLHRPGHHPLEKLVRTGAFFGSFLGGTALGLARGILTGDLPGSLTAAVTGGLDLGLALAGVEIKVVSGQEYLTAARPCVFVFNHQSNLDMPVMVHLVRENATGVAKKEIGEVPILGQILTAGGAVFVDRADAAKAIEQLDPVVDKIREEGLSLVVAPEGTRSATPRLGRFKKGPFHIAMQAGVPVVPVVLRNVGEVMWRDAALITPGTVEVQVLPPVDTSQWQAETVGEHTEQVRRMFVAALVGEHTEQVRRMFVEALTDWPVTDEPAADEPAAEEPATQAPAMERPTDEGTSDE